MSKKYIASLINPSLMIAIKKREERIGKKVKFTVYVDDIKKGQINPNQKKIMLDVPEGEHKFTVRYGKKNAFSKTFEVRKDMHLSLNSYIKNLKRHKILVWINRINLIVLLLFGSNDYILYINILILIICLPSLGRVFYYALFKKDQFFRLVAVKPEQTKNSLNIGIDHNI